MICQTTHLYEFSNISYVFTRYAKASLDGKDMFHYFLDQGNIQHWSGFRFQLGGLAFAQVWGKDCQSLLLVRVVIVGGAGLAAGREGVGALHEPAQGEEGGTSKDGGAPGVGVPPAVLPHCEPPLLPQRSGVGHRRVGRVRVPAARRAPAEPADAAGFLGRQ